MLKKENGFTIIELIIVMIILSIIGSIFFTSHLGERECIDGYLYYPSGNSLVVEKDTNGYPIQCISKK